MKVLERIDDNPGNNQPGILLIIGGNHVPGRDVGACCVQASLESLRILTAMVTDRTVGIATGIAATRSTRANCNVPRIGS